MNVRLYRLAWVAMITLAFAPLAEARAGSHAESIELSDELSSCNAREALCEAPEPAEGLADDAAGGENEEPEERDPLANDKSLLMLFDVGRLFRYQDEVAIELEFSQRLLEPPRR